MSQWERDYLNLTEAFRSAAEYWQGQLNWPALRDSMPDGDGHPVLLLPGFGASDLSTRPMRRALREKGYKAYGWDGGRNLGMSDEVVRHLRARLEEVFKENGNRKVTLIGHSLGGIYARELAREFPGMVRGVITIGTPFGIGACPDATPAALRALIEMLSKVKVSLNDKDMADRLLTPPPVPTTSIFSKLDGIAGWEACLNPATARSENIEVKACHIGSVWHQDTFAVVLNRLAQPEEGWKPFNKRAAVNDNIPANPKWKLGRAADKRFFPKP